MSSNEKHVRAWIPSLGILTAAAFGRPLSFWYDNRDQGVQPVELLVIGAVILVIGAAALWLLTRGRPGIQRCRVTVAVAASLIALYHWTALDDPFQRGDSVWVSTLVLSAVSIGAYGAARAEGVRVFAVIFVVSLSVIPASQLLIWSATTKPADLPAGPELTLQRSTDAPDIYLIVLDAYARDDVLERLYGYDNSAFLRSLESFGFDIVPDAKANYSMTYASIPSMLMMDYPVTDGVAVTDEWHLALNTISSGRNRVVTSLKAMGYEYVHVESGMGQTRCGPFVDRCVRPRALDETAWGLLADSPVRPFLGSDWGYFVHGALGALDAVVDVAGERVDGPRFVFAHVLAPHPPLFLDAQCEERSDPRLDDVVMGTPSRRPIIGRLRALYVEQLRCVNARLTRFLRTVDPRSVILLTADHGPASLEQLWTDIDRWSADQRAERFSIFTAYRVPEGCDREPPASVVNAFRFLLGCTHRAPLSLLDDVYRVVPRPLSRGERTKRIDVPAIDSTSGL